MPVANRSMMVDSLRALGALVALTALTCVPKGALATEYTKTTTLTHVGAQGNRPVQTSTQNSLWLHFASGPTWSVNGGSGGTVCPEGAAILPEDNAMMKSIALTAIAAGKQVMVAVDNSLPMVASYCQVSYLFVLAD